jgi:hypothetical protein
MADLDALRRLIDNDRRNLEYASGGAVPTDTMTILKVLADCAVRYIDSRGKGDPLMGRDAADNFSDAVSLCRRRMGIQ